MNPTEERMSKLHSALSIEGPAAASIAFPSDYARARDGSGDGVYVYAPFTKAYRARDRFCSIR